METGGIPEASIIPSPSSHGGVLWEFSFTDRGELILLLYWVELHISHGGVFLIV